MPEGHVLHRLAAGYTERFGDQPTHSSSPQGRFAVEAAHIDGQVLSRAHTYGKHLFCEFAEHFSVHIHLGLLGKVAFTDGSVPEPVGALRWRLQTISGPPHVADLRGATLCELITTERIDAIIAGLGPDPLRTTDASSAADADRAWARIHRSSTPIAVLLMDQRVTPGVGNIYRAELLYRHRIDPWMPGKLLKHAEWLRMWDDLVDLMRYGLRTGVIDTVREEHSPEALGRAPRVDRHGGEVYVYRRAGQPCLVCSRPVRITELAGRNLFWCTRCQPKTRRKG